MGTVTLALVPALVSCGITLSTGAACVSASRHVSNLFSGKNAILTCSLRTLKPLCFEISHKTAAAHQR